MDTHGQADERNRGAERARVSPNINRIKGHSCTAVAPSPAPPGAGSITRHSAANGERGR